MKRMRYTSLSGPYVVVGLLVACVVLLAVFTLILDLERLLHATSIAAAKSF